jgi:hypothetical protein
MIVNDQHRPERRLYLTKYGNGINAASAFDSLNRMKNFMLSIFKIAGIKDWQNGRKH